MHISISFDFRKPDCTQVFERCIEQLQRMQANPEILPALRAFYQDNLARFIS